VRRCAGGVTLSLIVNAFKFLIRQQKPFKVNIVKNMMLNFSIGLTQQYQSIYVIALGARAMSGFTMLAAVTESSLTVELVPKDVLGSWFGLLGFFTGLVSFAGPIIGSFV
jgi:hypothetical protein